MKLQLQWKDPDFALVGASGPGYDAPEVTQAISRGNSYDLPEELQRKFRERGIGEYILVEFDTETGETRVIP